MGSVKFVSISPDTENLISYCARVSNPSNQENYDTAPKLLRYCIKHKHWSPFEMANMVLEINTTRSISAQILRHRSFSFQEFSLRYATAIGSPVVPEIRLQDHKNRQNSVEVDDDEFASYFASKARDLFEQQIALYEEMIANGVAKEIARDVLPLATPTRLYMNGTIRSWIHYIDLRVGNGTQKEHRLLAEEAKQIFCTQLPVIAEALEWL